MSPYYQRLRDAIGKELLLIPSVAAVIHNADGRLLLQQKHDGTWSLPAGAIEPGETPEQAIAREVLEETGLRCTGSEVIATLGGPQFRYTYANGDPVEYLIALFKCAVDDETIPPTDTEETASLRWFTREEFPGLALPYPIELLFPHN